MTITRSLLSQIVPDVRKHIPGVKLRDAWVYKSGKQYWEFHFGDFVWSGRADNAYDARYNGWSAYLEKLGVAGYTVEVVIDLKVDRSS